MLFVYVCNCRECVECTHYKRGDLFEKNCNNMCRDEIVPVDELGNLFSKSEIL